MSSDYFPSNVSRMFVTLLVSHLPISPLNVLLVASPKRLEKSLTRETSHEEMLPYSAALPSIHG